MQWLYLTFQYFYSSFGDCLTSAMPQPCVLRLPLLTSEAAARAPAASYAPEHMLYRVS